MFWRFIAYIHIPEHIAESIQDCRYGGCVISQCISAGFASLPISPADNASDESRQYQLYSALGHFLGPASTEVHTQYVVEDVRTTKSFATRKIEAWQDWADKGMKRKVMILLLDFQVPEKASMFEYNVMPMYSVSDSSKSSPTSEVREQLETYALSKCEHYSSPDRLPTTSSYLSTYHTPEVGALYKKVFVVFDQYCDIRPVISSMGAQKAFSIAAAKETSQDGETITRRTNSHWFKIRDPPSSRLFARREESQSRGVHEAAVAFMMDKGLAMLPLVFASRTLRDMANCSSLELCLRFMRHPDIREWQLHEETTEAATGGRTLSTGRIWDGQGRLVAIMTQVGLMRPWPDEEKPSSKTNHSKL